MFPSLLVALVLAPMSFEDAPSAAAQTPSAAEVLDRAIEVQHGEKIGNSIKDFEVKLRLKRNDAQAKVELDVLRRFKAPDRIWTEVHEAVTGTTYVEGTDGSISWHSNAKDGVTIYDGPDFRTDVQRVEEDRRAMQLLMRFILLTNLKPTLTDLKRNEAEESKALKDYGMRTYVIEGRGTVTDTEIGSATVRLWVDMDDHRLMGARLERDSAPEHPLHFCFSMHRLNRQGVAIPGRVELYERDAPKPSQELVIEGEEHDGEVVNAMTFNGGIDDSVFLPPNAGEK
ncbi:MAG: hypothetical protein JNL94_01535 [Planctomycetes bacterium]|nr:hypothetical protein [Planctomycetota bacterium]